MATNNRKMNSKQDVADGEVVVKCEQESEGSGGGGGGEEVIISCLICLSTDNTGGPQPWKQFWRPGEPLSLSRNLSTVFLLRNLLRVGSGQVAALLTTTFGVEPGAWVRLCGVCSESVRKAYQLHQECLELQRKISTIGKHLRNGIGESWNVSDLGSVGKVEEDGDDGGWRTVINVHNIIRDFFQGCEWSNDNWDHQLKTLDQQDSNSSNNDDDHDDDGNDDEVEEDGSDSADPLYSPPDQNPDDDDEEETIEQEEVLSPPPPTTTRKSPRYPHPKGSMVSDPPSKRRKEESSSSSSQSTIRETPPPPPPLHLSKTRKQILGEKASESIQVVLLPRKGAKVWKGRSKIMSFECKFCQMSFGNRRKAEAHVRKTHLKPPPKRRPTSRFLQEENVDVESSMTARVVPRRRADVGRSKMIFECHYCQMVFGSRLKARSHIKKTHLKKKPQQPCPTCNHPFRCKPGKCSFQGDDPSSSETLQILFAQVETTEGKLTNKMMYKCKACEQTFKTRDGANSHVNKFHSMKPPPECQCPLCGHPTGCHEGRLKHMRRKHPKAKLKCDKCDPCFETNSASTYYKHDNEHKFKDSLEPVGDGKEGEEVELRCKLCGTATATIGNWTKMVRHLKNKHLPELGIPGFPCSMCEVVFLQNSQLTRHMGVHNVNKAGEQVATRPREFQCQLCPSAYLHRVDLQCHVRKVHSSSAGGGAGGGGGEQTRRNPQVHRRIHKCGICGSEFTLRRLLRSHLEREHPEHLRFKCEECGDGAGFESEVSLHRHVSESHRRQKRESSPKKPKSVKKAGNKKSEPFKCQKCDFSASAAAKRVIGRHLQEHVITDHFEDLGGDGSTARCRLCSAVCSSKGASANSLLFKHLRWSHPSACSGQLFQCHICGRGYNLKESLRVHIHWHKVSKPKPRPRGHFACQHCGREFTHLYLRKRHYRRCHSGVSGGPQSSSSASPPPARTRFRFTCNSTYSCDKCDFVTKVQTAFIHHIQNHSLTLHFQEVEVEGDEGPSSGVVVKYLCKLCGIRCSRIRRYAHLNQMHAQVVGLQLYQCHICGKGFNKMRNLRVHLAWHGQNNSPAEQEGPSSSSSEVVVVCELCGQLCTSVSQLESHRRKLHSSSDDLKKLEPSSSSRAAGPRQIKCRVCGVVLDVPPGSLNTTLLSAHMKEAHGELYKFGCELCDQRFLESNLLQVHLERDHFSERRRGSQMSATTRVQAENNTSSSCHEVKKGHDDD